MVILKSLDFTFIGLVHGNTLHSFEKIKCFFYTDSYDSINVRLHLDFEASFAMLTQKVIK